MTVNTYILYIYIYIGRLEILQKYLNYVKRFKLIK